MKTGLRTEIVVSLCLLLGAALLFAGFLLVKLTEQELLAQQRHQARSTVGMLTAMLTESTIDIQNPVQVFNRLQRILDNQTDITGWRLLDPNQQPIGSLAAGEMPSFEPPSPLLEPGEIRENLYYSSAWAPWHEKTASYLDLTARFAGVGDLTGLLQVRYSLENLTQRVHRAQRLVLIYVVVYGLILVVFGIYLLNRNVVRPVRRLQQATAEVAAGSLTHVDIGNSPGEISDLAASFNRMVAALEQSRAETKAHIDSLETANLALQQARDDLVRSEKMASVGHLAAGMAHEIGNPLGAMIGYLGILKADLQEDSAQDLLNRSLSETGRIDKLVRELLDYATPGCGEREVFSAVNSLRETVDMLEHQGLFDSISIEDRCGEIVGEIAMDRQQLQQVWVNLLLNAKDSMEGDGAITLAAEENDGVRIIIADQGGGVRAEVASQIFEPFFTTKDPGKGRGLGLAVCQRIVTEAGGRIDVMSGQAGATFTVSLPGVREEDR